MFKAKIALFKYFKILYKLDCKMLGHNLALNWQTTKLLNSTSYVILIEDLILN